MSDRKGHPDLSTSKLAIRRRSVYQSSYQSLSCKKLLVDYEKKIDKGVAMSSVERVMKNRTGSSKKINRRRVHQRRFPPGFNKPTRVEGGSTMREKLQLGLQHTIVFKARGQVQNCWKNSVIQIETDNTMMKSSYRGGCFKKRRVCAAKSNEHDARTLPVSFQKKPTIFKIHFRWRSKDLSAGTCLVELIIHSLNLLLKER